VWPAKSLDTPSSTVYIARIDPLREPAAAEPGAEPRSLAELERLLDAEDAVVRRSAAREIGLHGPAAKPALPKLVALLTDPDPKVRFAVVDAIAKTGPDGAATLTNALSRVASERRPWLASALWRMGKTAVPALVAGLGAEDRETRAAAAEGIALLGAAAEAALPALVAGLADESGRVRRKCVEAIGAIGAGALPAVPDLVRILEDPESRARREAARALGRIVLDLPTRGRERRVRRFPTSRWDPAEAMEAGLVWLVAHQDASGRWDSDNFMKHDPRAGRCDGAGGAEYDLGVTALAALALVESGALGPGEGPERLETSARMALAALIAAQDHDGCLGSQEKKPSCHTYAHMIGTYALAEAWLRTGDPLEPPDVLWTELSAPEMLDEPRW